MVLYQCEASLSLYSIHLQTDGMVLITLGDSGGTGSPCGFTFHLRICPDKAGSTVPLQLPQQDNAVYWHLAVEYTVQA